MDVLRHLELNLFGWIQLQCKRWKVWNKMIFNKICWDLLQYFSNVLMVVNITHDEMCMTVFEVWESLCACLSANMYALGCVKALACAIRVHACVHTLCVGVHACICGTFVGVRTYAHICVLMYMYNYVCVCLGIRCKHFFDLQTMIQASTSYKKSWHRSLFNTFIIYHTFPYL